MIKKITNLLKRNKNENRSMLIVSIIEKRAYSISKEFNLAYVDESVIDILLCNFCKRISTSSTYDLKDNVCIKTFPKLYRETDRLHPEMNLFSYKYMKKIDTAVSAIVLLRRDNEWKLWLKLYPKYTSSVVHGSYLLTLFHVFKKQMPEYVLRYFVLDKHGSKIAEAYIMNNDADACEMFIKSIESLECPRIYIKYLCIYWSKGGTYFPENIEFVKPYLDEIPDINTYLCNLRKNIPENKPSLGLETYFALDTMLSGLEPEDDDDVAYSFTKSVTSAIDYLFHIAKKDINILWAIVNTNIPSGVYQGILKYDGNYRGEFLDLLEHSNVPLKDAKLYFELFDNTEYTRMSLDAQRLFLRRGGSPKTLVLENDSDDAMYNICYTQSGLCEILTNSNKSDVMYMIDFNERFRRFIVHEMNRCSLSYLNTPQFLKLFDCIIDRKYEGHASMKPIANYIFRLLGEDTLIKQFPYAIKLLTESRVSKMFYPTAIQYLTLETLPYVPIRLLSGDVVNPYVTKKMLDGTTLPILNTEQSYLDLVMTTTQLDSLFFDKKNIGYIADLSIEEAEHYITSLVEKCDDTYNMTDKI